MLTPDGKIKRWSEMTPEELTADQLRHIPKLLNRWKGGYAKLWSYSVSLRTLAIRIERPGVKGNLQISCYAEHICCPTMWENANIEVTLEPGVGYVVQDRVAGVRIVGGPVLVAENVHPVHVGLPLQGCSAEETSV